MQHRTRAALAALIAFVLVVAACADRDDADTSSDDGTEDDAGDSEAGAAEGDFGDLQGVCGPNEGGGAVPDADEAEILGVTESSLTVGTIADPGFEGRPGLNQEIFDAGTAFVEWCNAAGGINGRQLELNLHDAAITNYPAAITEACATDFAVVGDGAVQDNQWTEFGPDCDLIDVAGFSVTGEKAGAAGADLVEARAVQPLPAPGDRFQLGPYLQLAEDFPDAVESTGVIYGDLATLIEEKDGFVEAVEGAGFDVVHESSYNLLGEASWAPLAQGIADDGVELLHFVGEPENLALLVSAMDELGDRPEVIVVQTNFYDPAFIDAAGPSADGVFIQTVFSPFEEAGDNPATQQYVDNVEAIDGKTATLGMQSTSAWLLFAQAVKTCDLDDDLTRSCVLAEVSSTSDWTGGGLHAPTDPSANEPTPCFVLIQVQDGEFARYAPDEGFDCGEGSDDEYVVEVSG